MTETHQTLSQLTSSSGSERERESLIGSVLYLTIRLE